MLEAGYRQLGLCAKGRRNTLANKPPHRCLWLSTVRRRMPDASRDPDLLQCCYYVRLDWEATWDVRTLSIWEQVGCLGGSARRRLVRWIC